MGNHKERRKQKGTKKKNRKERQNRIKQVTMETSKLWKIMYGLQMSNVILLFTFKELYIIASFIFFNWRNHDNTTEPGS